MNIFSLDFLNEMERMRREIDRVLGEDRFSTWTFPFSRISFLPGRASRAYPLMNISEDSENIYVDALAPGLETGTLNISIANNQLVIAGEKKSLPKDVKPESIHRSDRSTGQFVRSMSLSVGVDSGKVHANYKDGLLQVILPKSEASKPKQVQVRVD
jgi:HSP20 family protein